MLSRNRSPAGPGLAVLVRHNLLLMRREPGPLLSRMILPIAFLTLLRPLYLAAWHGGAAGNQQAVIATLVTFSLLALSISGSAILTERLGVIVRSVGALSASYDIGGMLLSSMGGALVPLAVLPHWVRSVAPASPGYWAARSLRSAFAGDTHGVLLGCLVLAGVAVTCGAIASMRLRGTAGRLVAL